MTTMMHEGMVSITFDDGRLTALTQGADILEKYGLKGTFYIITSLLGTENTHGKYGEWSHVKSLTERGHEVGNHTHTHPKGLEEADTREQKSEIEKAHELLDVNGINARTFAYPYGVYGDSLVGTVKSLGYESARTTNAGLNNTNESVLKLNSFVVEDKHTLEDVGREIQKAKDEKKWLILTFHHIDDKTFISTPPELFEKMIQSIHNSGIKVVTVSEGVEQMYH